MKKMILFLLTILMVGAMVLSGCKSTGEAVAARAPPVTLDGLMNAVIYTNSDYSGVNCNTICKNAVTPRKYCVGAYMGYEHDVANVGEAPEMITEWLPVSCLKESLAPSPAGNPLRCVCY